MSDLPFGFQPPNDDGKGSGGNPQDPFALFGGGGGQADLSAALHRFADLMSWSGGPVNWDLARDVAVESAGESDLMISPGQTQAVSEALRLADLWLDGVTPLPTGIRTTEAWSRKRWVQATLPVWSTLADPVAQRVVDALSALSAPGGQLAESMPPEMAAMGGALSGMFKQIGGAMFGSQVGQALGMLAGEVVSSTEIGLPLGPAGVAALVPTNVVAFGEGIGVPEDQVRLYLALREAAHQRLFAHVPWLRSHLLSLVDEYARGITVDMSAIESAVAELDPTNPEALQTALAGGMFEPQATPAQQASLERLETALALVEGWVDEVVDSAASAHLPGATALRETTRRRRAAGGPAEQAFATLVGLELRPRRLREAASLWAMLGETRGIDGRDAVWAHPDLMPGTADLDDPASYVSRDSGPLDLSSLGDLDAADAPTEPSAAERSELRDGDA
ncbi:zinc-dependent metalloprotease [Acidothermaceae bacterium B102]|nr:zinc-dependent metalloprotease [Acidothermaceae bacterium B102]